MNILYKYLYPERVDVLQTGKIRFTQPSDFNDVFETKPFITSISNPTTMDENIETSLRKKYDSLSDIEKKWVPFDFLKNVIAAKMEEQVKAMMPRVRTGLTKDFDESLGILSLSEERSNLLMWAHYADNHRGYVISFDPSHSYFNDKTLPENDSWQMIRKVIYSKTRPQNALTELKADELFLIKSEHWSYEHEWRMVRELKNADSTEAKSPYPICLFNYPAEAVLEVILGCRMHIENKKAIMRALTENEQFQHVEILQAEPNEREFSLDYYPVKR